MEKLRLRKAKTLAITSKWEMNAVIFEQSVKHTNGLIVLMCAGNLALPVT